MPKILDDMPPEYLQAIGEVIVHWNFFDHHLNLALGQMISGNRGDLNAHIALAHMSFPQKVDVLGTFFNKIEDPIYLPLMDRYKTVLQPLIKKAQSGRSFVVHSTWGAKEGKVMTGSFKARGKLEFGRKEVTLEDIRGATLSIDEARKSLLELVPPYKNKRARSRKRGKS